MKKEAQEPTHTIRTDTVNKDASVKRIEIDFCKTDHWSECWPGMMNIAEMFQAGINTMIAADADAVGSQETILNARTCAPIETVIISPNIIKPEYFVQAKEDN
ncbi:hypothetical protein [Sphingobacterium siyangense]|uniref:Uncharacterized protein n=1 Tax=Sphingobacterium siyangense TaxID=459529 RepID=A0A562M8P2_9SPHI|nr:hypothetical protein [Sphingobacterium siyangense]TWI16305.1 hypothetical protein IQ31_04460 [Sphingobacterium siyangense]